MDRRSFLCGAALATSAILPAPSVAADRSAELTAIPTDVAEKIKAWQEAHRATTRAHTAYRAGLQDADGNEHGRLYEELRAAEREVGPAREAMIMALWRV